MNTSHSEQNGNSNTSGYHHDATPYQDDAEGQTFAAGVRAIWQRPTFAGSLAKDLPRLARRITVRTRTGRWVVIFPCFHSSVDRSNRNVLLLRSIHKLQQQHRTRSCISDYSHHCKTFARPLQKIPSSVRYNILSFRCGYAPLQHCCSLLYCDALSLL